MFAGMMNCGQRILQSLPESAAEHRRLTKIFRSLSKNQQACSQIAAIHRGQITGQKGLERRRLVPVVEVSLQLRQPSPNGEVLFPKIHQRVKSQKAEVSRNQAGDEKQSFIRRRNSFRQFVLW